MRNTSFEREAPSSLGNAIVASEVGGQNQVPDQLCRDHGNPYCWQIHESRRLEFPNNGRMQTG